MKYFYDFEFMDDGKTINPISIGMVSEDGSHEFYAEFADAKLSEANPWVRENVIPHLWQDRSVSHGEYQWYDKRVRDGNLQGGFWFADRIAEGLRLFCDPEKYGKPEFWGYYSAYDHVALCQLFGPMIDLPKGWPMYTNDIKQFCVSLGDPALPQPEKKDHHSLFDARWNRETYRFLTWRDAFYRQSVARSHRTKQGGTIVYEAPSGVIVELEPPDPKAI